MSIDVFSKFLVFLFLFLTYLNECVAWDSEQLQVFDAIDEVKVNFYDLLNVSQEASSSEIRSAFRTLSLKLHPDKNLETDTSEEFRNLVSVYEVLKSPTKRKYYDEVLVNGLPNWRSAVYYYRYVRKMGVAEVCVILFVIITIGQYIVNWAVYFERKFTIQENLKRKRSGKKFKNDSEDLIDHIQKPTFWNTLPFQLPKLCWYSVVSLPVVLGLLKKKVAQQIEEATKPPAEPEPEQIRIRTVRKRNKFVVPQGPNFEMNTSLDFSQGATKSETVKAPPLVSGGLWTDDDLDELVRLVKKFPPGSVERWENIAEALQRPVTEVTYMANKIKENGYRMSTEKEEEIPVVKIKQKTKKNIEIAEDTVKKWSQMEQKKLEEALMKYPKGHSERWDKIADHVLGKTKEECIMRYKYVTEMLKKQKEASTNDC
ncbi:hypothetical protein ABEB36_003226 [Hypothenemus hampei]|uniref:DnaJ homolog subfamily C member 1 n=1 Tax=Hypothenemus hampei TaxID=57062 RepID=A0ABD1F963_HYPHA